MVIKMNIEQYIDHTLLKSDSSFKDIEKLCEEAVKYNFYSVCINPFYVEYAKTILKNTNVKICTVVGFPLGAATSYIKCLETEEALLNGADEIDMVMNIGQFKSENYEFVEKEIRKIKNICKNKILKVIIETSTLKKEEIERACEIVVNAGADYIKSSTGYGKYGARREDILIMLQNAKDLKVKASGGISDYKTALEYINMGVSRIGTSNGVNIADKKIEKEINDY